ncbi:MAG: ketoacyl-ACP synthase III [Firmicutes bacterium]|nr:ketoacyl-ACP synthase III [Bacillota bacterium]
MKQETVGITGTGHALPKRVLSNRDLEKMIDTSDRWIRERTGIIERRIISEGESTLTLAVKASQQALQKAGLLPEELDMIIVASVTPEQALPSTACLVQAKLNAKNASAFDLTAGCTGFIYALTIAKQFIANSSLHKILVIGVDILSYLVDWEDRKTCVLFGDGAGAVVMEKVNNSRGIIATRLYSEGSKADLLYIPGGGTVLPITKENLDKKLNFIKMNGPEVFKFAVKVMVESTQEVLKMDGKTAADLSYLIPHQANIRIIDTARKRLGMEKEKVLTNIEKYGNMSSASIPVLLDEAVEKGLFRQGDLLGMVAFGAGFTWGACLMEWSL